LVQRHYLHTRQKRLPILGGVYGLGDPQGAVLAAFQHARCRFCVEALEEAIAKYGKPEIMNTDQGSQYTGAGWITNLTKADIKISMDGRGRYLDNIFIERLWRPLKQEAVYLYEITPSRQIALQSPAGQRMASKRNGSSIIGLGSTTRSALTRPLISEHQASHTLATRKHEKRHEHTPDAS
jgi:transposase InsO family protein